MTSEPVAGSQLPRRSIQLFSEHPGKRAVERYWLLYTPVWGAVAGIIITEIAVVIAVALGMAAVLTAATAQLAPDLIRAIVLS